MNRKKPGVAQGKKSAMKKGKNEKKEAEKREAQM